MSEASTPEILLVTGLAGAGKSTVLRTLEDMGWEFVDHLPIALLDRLLSTAPVGDTRPIAIGVGTLAQEPDAQLLIEMVEQLRRAGRPIEVLFLDCQQRELERRFAETRRRHPLALDRPAADGIVRERELLRPIRHWADRLVDTSALSANQLQAEVRRLFAREGLGETTVSVQSFGFSRGVPTGADLVFDVRFLRNPHWVPELRPGTGLDPDVAAYVAADPIYADAIGRIEELLLLLLPRYRAEGKPYVTIAFGCTGGRHRSVHVAERVAARLRDAGFSPTVVHRDLKDPVARVNESR